MVSKDIGQVHLLDSTEISMIRSALWSDLKDCQPSDKYRNKEKELFDLFDRLSKDCDNSDSYVCYALTKTVELEFKPYDSYPGSYDNW